jgi:ABC-type branched-subunit amino acid transport system substrate-binding protein
VFSISNITAAVECNAHGIPFIAPTATDTGLTGIGRYVYQLNFTPTVQAEALAELAAGTVAASSAAIIASKDAWGQETARVFAREAEKRNVKIIRTDYFNPESDSSDDINAIMRNLRKIAPKPEAFTDSTNATVRIAAADTTEVDSTLYTSVKLNPIDTIKAVFISATAPDAIKIASKLMEFNIVAMLLGDSGWNRSNVPEEGRQYVDGAILVAPPGQLSRGLGPVFQSGDSWNDDRLTVAMKGYDAGKLLLHCITQGAKDPESLAENLSAVQDFQGSASRISIDPSLHTNTAVDFVRIHNRKYEKMIPAVEEKK